MPALALLVKFNSESIMDEIEDFSAKSQYYIINKDKSVSMVEDLEEWSKQYDSPDRIVKQESIEGIKISTVFLGLDHNFRGGPPLLFETMVFFDGLSSAVGYEYQTRCSTYEQALDMHQTAVELVNKAVIKAKGELQ